MFVSAIIAVFVSVTALRLRLFHFSLYSDVAFVCQFSYDNVVAVVVVAQCTLRVLRTLICALSAMFVSSFLFLCLSRYVLTKI